MKGWNRGINGVVFPNCCKDCIPPRRSPHCHASCKDYLDAKEEFDIQADAERAARKAARESESVTFLLRKG